MVREKPTPTDPKTLAQIYHRWLYQDYANWWNTLSAAIKQLWETNARRQKITGFNYWMRHKLTNLPDIAGGWHLDEKSGSAAIDFSKNANHGTITGASHVPALIDYGLSFDGLDDYVKCGTDPSLRPAHLTVMCFVKFNALDDWQHLIDNTDSRNHLYGYRFTLTSLNKFRWRIRGTDDNLHTLISDGTYLADVQYHFAATYDEENLIIFVNGQEVKRQAETNPIKYNSSEFAIGSYHFPTDSPKAIIDEVLVLNRVLSQPEILAHSQRRYPL